MPIDRSGDQIEAVLRSTGPRPPVPSDLAARVEARVRAHWAAEVRARRLWRWRSVAIAAAAAIVLGVTASMVTREAAVIAPTLPMAATVQRVVDTAWSQSSSSSALVALHRGDHLTAGTELATEDRGRVALLLAGGHSLRLDAGTRLRIVSDRVVALDRGAVYVDSRTMAGATAGSIEIRTPLGTVRDIGTQFEVRAQDAALSVRVREGRVVVEAAGTRVDVDEGHQLQLSSNGEVTRREIAGGTAFEWLGSVTPMIEIDGRSLQSFLEWAARERGLRLEFASAGTASAARTIVLSGSVQGMTIDEALESVLATSRMSPAVEGNVLRILPSGESRGAR